MYKIINLNNGETIGYTDSPYYIKLSAAGNFTPTRKEIAQGIAYHNIPYNLNGCDGVGADITVSLKQIDFGDLFDNNNSILNLYKERLDMIEDALCELDKTTET